MANKQTEQRQERHKTYPVITLAEMGGQKNGSGEVPGSWGLTEYTWYSASTHEPLFHVCETCVCKRCDQRVVANACNPEAKAQELSKILP